MDAIADHGRDPRARRGARAVVPQHRPPACRPRRTISSATIRRSNGGASPMRIPADLTGKSVLDIGCNAGFYSMEMKRRGAERVLGIDFDDDYLAQARFAAEVDGLDIEFRQALGLRRRRARRALRHRAVHGRALPPAPSVAGARPDPRACGRRPDGLPVDAARQRRRSSRSTRDYPFCETRRSSTARLSRSCISSSTAMPTTRPTGGCRTAPAPRRCCAAPASRSSATRRRRSTLPRVAGAGHADARRRLSRAERS